MRTPLASFVVLAVLAACSAEDVSDPTYDTSNVIFDGGTADTGGETNPTDTGAVEDTTPEDTGAPDTTETDTAVEDTTETDTAVEDTTETDTAETDTTVEDTTPDTDVSGDVGLSGPGNPDSLGTGVRRSIAIDGENTGGEWDTDTLLILDPGADDARMLGGNWSAHEAPWDYVALHAAWDDDYLYVGIQYTNLTDVLDPSNLGSSEGSPIQVLDTVQYVAFNTIDDAGYVTGGDMWGKDHTFVGDDHPEVQLYFHSNFSQEGTYLSTWDGSAWQETTNGHLTEDLTGAGGEFYVGSTLMGVDPHSDDDDPGNYGPADIDYIGDRGHATDYDTFFELQIPLELLGLDATSLDSLNIGVFAGNGDGSGVDSVPNDPATSDTPGTSDSNSPLEWSAEDDDDAYTVPFARVGAL